MVVGSQPFFQREEVSFGDYAIVAFIKFKIEHTEATTVHLGKLAALSMAQRGGHCC
jgi:hypothetical protein